MKTTKLSHGYEMLVGHVMSNGMELPSRQGPTMEIQDVLILVDSDPALTGFPGYRHEVGLTEAAQIIAGRHDLGELQRFAPGFADYSDGYGAYSDRLAAQIPALLTELKTNPQSRRAILTPWSAQQDLLDLSGKPHGLQHLDHPCTLSLGFRIREDFLNMSVTMRSNDMWLGLPIDFTMFRVLQHTLAQVLGVGVGSYTHYSHSLHIYHRNMDKIKDWLGTFEFPWDQTTVSPVYAFGTGTWESAQEEALRALQGDLTGVRTRSAQQLANYVSQYGVVS